MGCCWSSEEPIDFESAEVDLYHFELHRALGKGAFGKVRVVGHKRDGKLYALKYIDKRQCISMKAVNNIVQERRLLEEVDHPFVVNMRFAFQDDENCFMVLDLMLGGDLRFHARRINCDEATIRFYMAELSSALSYLHSKNIIHRDIKPDNVLLDEAGHAHLTDFNVACHFTPGRGLTSVAGTVYYMAPEMISRKGYTWTADWWSLGVMAYELMFGERPLDGKRSAEVMRKIMNEPIMLPEKMPKPISDEGRDFVFRLLERNVPKRIGCKGIESGLAQIRSHRWFASYDWAAVDNKTMLPPYVPDASKLNFDMTLELDEYMSPSHVLTHKKRKPRNLDTHPHGKEHKTLEDEFTVWDYQKMTRRNYHGVTQPMQTVKRSASGVDGTPLPSRPGSASGPRPSDVFNISREAVAAPGAVVVSTRPSNESVPRDLETSPAADARQTPRSSNDSLSPPPDPVASRPSSLRAS